MWVPKASIEALPQPIVDVACPVGWCARIIEARRQSFELPSCFARYDGKRERRRRVACISVSTPAHESASFNITYLTPYLAVSPIPPNRIDPISFPGGHAQASVAAAAIVSKGARNSA